MAKNKSVAMQACSLEISKALSRTLKESEIKEVGDLVSEVIEKFDKETQVADLSAQVKNAIDQVAKDLETAALLELRNSALNASKRIDAVDSIMTNWADQPGEGIKAIMGGSQADRFGSRNNLASHIKGLQHEYEGGLFSRLMEMDLVEFAAKESNFDDLFLARAELSRKNPNPEVLKKFSREVIETAKIFNEYSEVSRVRANNAGGWIGKLEGRVLRRSHDQAKIQRAAGKGIPTNDPRHMQAWVDFMKANLDLDATFPGVKAETQDKLLSSLYQQFSNGYHLTFGQSEPTGFKGGANIGKKLSHEQVFKFKTSKAELDYYKRFGLGDKNMVDASMMELRMMARDTAIMEKLGPNAKDNLDSIVDEVSKKLTAENKGHLAAEFQEQYKAEMRRLWPYLTGEGNVPENGVFASGSQAVRNLTAMGTLTNIVLSAITDIPNFAATMRYFGSRDNMSFFQGMNDALSEVLGGIGKSITPDQVKLASELGVFLETAVTKFGDEEDLFSTGALSKSLQKMFKYNGSMYWQNRIRLAAVKSQAHRHALHGGLKFADLPEGMQASFRQYGMGEAQWDLIRSLGKELDEEGREFFTPQMIKDAPLERFDSLPGVKDRIADLREKGGSNVESKINKVREAARDELAGQYRTMFSDISYMATTEPGAVERGMLLQGTRPGTPVGEAVRHFSMVKSFTTSLMRKHLGRELHGYHAERLPTHKAILRMLKDPSSSNSGAAGLANMVVWNTLFGYAAMTLKDLSKGKKPREITDLSSFSQVFLASAAQGGALGIYGDFLFGDMKSRFGHSALETMLGPSFGRVSDLTDIVTRLKTGEDVGPKAFQFAINNTPVVNSAFNMFYTKWAFDWAITHRMQETMRPGYLRRLERNMKKNKNQEFIIPPSSYIPYGGGF